ncbi:hypothetical protein [Chitinophaga sancti]|uniref:Uncharacterized protein n=1 Tax=Chitinophaga sancti TaxID=1004 RepID=A0A1K1RXG5_9BACT|nr:hypothetical protein [Chitinophaga sancti]WQD64010.1 hypothetical protein U0033_06350 [Chitinophaga sancti]WQG90366.1 hypothetical protein SR876_02570 [Chitinophaga sancti]SFW76479.1 hypothetical protein SAMN05661012_04363 [Chitinophaga sancti]
METQTDEAQKVLVAAAAANSLTTTLNISFVSADEIDVDFNTMPGNQPNTYGNFIAIWQNSNAIPWNTEPLKTFPIPSNTQSGSASFTGLNVTNNSYIVGYAVGQVLNATGNIQKYGNVCSSAFIPAASSGEGVGTIFTPSISGINVGTTSVSFQFDLPDGLLPQTNGAWAAIWKGANPSFYSTAPLASIPISPDSSSGRAAFNNVSIGRGTTYTIAIFMSGYNAAGVSTQRAAACATSFTN